MSVTTSGSDAAGNDPRLVDVLSLEGFRSTLDGRLTEAMSVRASLNDLVHRNDPKLGNLPDGVHVGKRYGALYLQAIDRVTRLINAIHATKTALDTIIQTYTTTEARLTADAEEIDEALDGVSGVHHGGSSHAR
jgi:hypothetical protein